MYMVNSPPSMGVYVLEDISPTPADTNFLTRPSQLFLSCQIHLLYTAVSELGHHESNVVLPLFPRQC